MAPGVSSVSWRRLSSCLRSSRSVSRTPGPAGPGFAGRLVRGLDLVGFRPRRTFVLVLLVRPPRGPSRRAFVQPTFLSAARAEAPPVHTSVPPSFTHAVSRAMPSSPSASCTARAAPSGSTIDVVADRVGGGEIVGAQRGERLLQPALEQEPDGPVRSFVGGRVRHAPRCAAPSASRWWRIPRSGALSVQAVFTATASTPGASASAASRSCSGVGVALAAHHERARTASRARRR